MGDAEPTVARCPKCGDVTTVKRPSGWCDACVEDCIIGADDYDGDGWCEACQNTGSLDCCCGGDLCVCLNHGEYPCPHCR
jgi:hypothetical protein